MSLDEIKISESFAYLRQSAMRTAYEDRKPSFMHRRVLDCGTGLVVCYYGVLLRFNNSKFNLRKLRIIVAQTGCDSGNGGGGAGRGGGGSGGARGWQRGARCVQRTSAARREPKVASLRSTLWAAYLRNVTCGNSSDVTGRTEYLN